MLLHDSRREARVDAQGNIVTLEEQNRSLWNHEQIAEALPIVEDALRNGAGSYALQAAIAAEHCKSRRAEDTDWPGIVRLYDLLQQVQPDPIISLNRAVALAMADNPEAALATVNQLTASGELEQYHLLHATRADLLRRMGRPEEAAKSYERALMLVTNESERRFLERRLREAVSTAA